MLDIKTVITQRPDLFDNLASRWRGATGGELVLLSPRGTVIQSHNGTAAILSELIDVSETGDVAVRPHAEAIITPMMVHGELKGHLLSKNSLPDQLPMLTWAAETLLDHLNSEHALQGMTDELIVAWDQLELVYRINTTLGEHSNLSNVLNSVLKEIVKVVTAETIFILFEYDGQFNCVTTGIKKLPSLDHDQRLLDEMAALDQLVLFNDRKMTLEVWPNAPESIYNFVGASIVTHNDIKAALGLVNNRKNGQKRDFTAGVAKLITSVAEQIGPIFDYFKLQDELLAQERLRSELEIAAHIQENLLSRNTPQVKGLKFAVKTIPAYEVGGDFYDFTSTSENQLTTVIGDVAGKGIPAAMFTSMIRTMLRVETLHSQEPHVIINRVNEALHQDLGRADLFVTTFVATFDTKSNVLMYANAGHVPGIIYHAQSQTSRLLKATSLPIGIAGYPHRATQYVHISDGDTLVIFSDGITEATNPQGQQFGVERVRDLVHKHAGASPDVLKETLFNEVKAFSQSDIRTDDVTLVVIVFSLEETRTKEIKSYRILDTLPFKYAADTVHLSDISNDVTKACRSLNNLPGDSKGDDFVYLVELAISEICTNIIEHAYMDKTGYITGKITLTSVGIEIDVYDQGRGFNPNLVPPPMSDPMDPTEGGYGLHIVRQIMDVAKYVMDTPLGNHWKLIKYLPQ